MPLTLPQRMRYIFAMPLLDRRAPRAPRCARYFARADMRRRCRKECEMRSTPADADRTRSRLFVRHRHDTRPLRGTARHAVYSGSRCRQPRRCRTTTRARRLLLSSAHAHAIDAELARAIVRAMPCPCRRRETPPLQMPLF